MRKNYNTILMNVYKDNKDAIVFQQDNENGWVKETGFASLAFGCDRPFVIQEIATGERQKIIHKSGEVIEMPYPMNNYYTHSVPACSKAIASDWRKQSLSLTFREIRGNNELIRELSSAMT
jgi:alkylated DNA repair dioxygenase AlkB